MGTKKRIGSVQINSSFSGQNYFPYSIGILQAYAKKYLSNPKNFEFLLPIYKREPMGLCLEKLLDTDIAFFSTYIWSLKASSEIARELKRRKPGILTVYGGFAVPKRENVAQFLAENPFVDIVCHGEGEKAYKEILGNSEEGDWTKVPSISFKDKFGNVIHTPEAERITNLDDIPSPYLEGVFDPLMRANPNEGWIGLWETTRGCPFTCAYCEWGCDSRKKIHAFSLERLFKEIDWFSENKIEFIRCCDSNFGILERDMELAKRLAKNKKSYGYPHKVSVESTKTSPDRIFELHRTLAKEGLSNGVNLAVQSLNEKTLKAIRRKNIPLESFNYLQRKFTLENIPTFSDVILGLPEETYDSFIDGSIRLLEKGQHNRIYFFNLLLLPNAEMSSQEYQEKYGLITKEIRQLSIHGDLDNESTNETERIVIGSKTMPPEDWVKSRAFAWRMSLLYYDKLLQLPLAIAARAFNARYRNLFDDFAEADVKRYPVIGEINSYFFKKAREIQEGGSEYSESPQWLNMCWYPNELMILEMCRNGKLSLFYEESRKIIEEGLEKRKIPYDSEVLREAIILNRELLKQPFNSRDTSLQLRHNLWEVYRSALIENAISLKEGKFTYELDRTGETWNSWEDWAKKVIWYKHKKGDYLYPCKPKI